MDEVRAQNHLDASPKPYRLSFLWLAAISTLVGSLTENIAYFQGWGIYFDSTPYYLLFVASILGCVGYLVFAHLSFHAKPSILWTILISLIFLGNVVALLAFPSKTFILNSGGEEIPYSLSQETRLHGICSFSATCLLLYVYIAIAPQTIRSSRSLLSLTWVYVACCYALIFYSLAKEGDAYLQYFDPDIASADAGNICSFTNNRNTFATALVIGLCCLGVLQSHKHHWWTYLLMAPLYVELFFVQSRTGLLLGTAFLCIFCLYRYVRSVKAHPWKANLIFWGFVCLMLAFALAVFVFAKENPTSALGKLLHSIRDRFVKIDDVNLDARLVIWNQAMAQMKDPVRKVFGLGTENYVSVMAYAISDGTMGFTHNGLLAEFAAGGFLRASVYLFFLVYCIYAFIVAVGHHRRGAFSYALGILIMACHGLTETTSFFFTDLKGISIHLLFILPLLMEYWQAKHPEAKRAMEEAAAHPASMEKNPCKTNRVQMCSALLSPLALATACLPFASQAGKISESLAGSIVVISAFILFTSPLLFGIGKKKEGERWFLQGYVPYLILAGSCLFLGVFLSLHVDFSSQRRSTFALIFVLVETIYFVFVLQPAWQKNFLCFNARKQVERDGKRNEKALLHWEKWDDREWTYETRKNKKRVR